MHALRASSRPAQSCDTKQQEDKRAGLWDSIDERTEGPRRIIAGGVEGSDLLQVRFRFSAMTRKLQTKPMWSIFRRVPST
jgi:hypothetical protein